MIKKIIIFSFLSTSLITPITLDLTALRNERNSSRMLDALQAFSQYSTETITRNDDEEDFASDRRGNFGKSLHLDLTTPIFHKTEYDNLLAALASEQEADFEALVMGATDPNDQAFKLVSPQALFATDFSAADGWTFSMPAAPSITSAEAAGEMVEVYWHALLRDIPFNAYDEVDTPDTLQQRAIAGMNALTDFKGPKDSGFVTAQTLFRGVFPGETTGPYISQFLYLPLAFGPGINYNGSGSVAPFDSPDYQTLPVPVAGSTNDFMITEAEWANIQRGLAPSSSTTFDETERHFIRNARDLAEYVHHDYPGGAAFNAAFTVLRMFGSDALDDNMYYNSAGNNAGDTQVGFVTFGIASIISAVIKVSELALKAAWFHKWYVHRRLRPEFFGYLIEHEATLNSGLHADITGASVFSETIFTTNGNRLLPMAYPEGSPCHPSYPAGHAAFIGAAVTVLKAFFKESFEIPNPVEPNATNDTLTTYTGTALTIESELNKLASNIAIGRNMAGVHYRSDGTEGILLGEKVAIKFLQDLGATYHEGFAGFSLTKFDGTTLTGLGAKV